MSSTVRPTFFSILGSARVLGIAVAVAVFAVVLPAFSQDADLKGLLDRLQRLERDIQTLNVGIARGGSAPSSAGTGGATSLAPTDFGPGLPQTVARMEVRLTALEDEVRAATGQAEMVNHQFDQINQRLDKLVGDIDYRLGVLEKGQAELRGQAPGGGTPAQATATGGPGVAAVPAPQPVQTSQSGLAGAAQPGVLGTLSRQDAEKINQGGAPAKAGPEAAVQQTAAQPGVLPQGAPKDQYTYAFGLLRQTRYDEAEAALKAFLKANANDPLASNARYWLGETFYVRGDYVKAAETFLEGYQKDPKGSKAADTLLKLGMSLSNLDKKREACAAFDKLGKEFSDVPSNIQRVVVRERQKNACN